MASTSMQLPLVAGSEPAERLEILFRLLPRMAKKTKQALLDHLVHGAPVELCCYRYQLLQPNFSRALATLNNTNHLVEQVKDFDLYRLKDIKNAKAATTQSA
ncbi:PapB/FocB family fimbrial expression transcriptional regulator [Bowmanella dokdonensis]|uniref:Uncharacterized protein n=1 Tax=Bowmanella dokdonensis TaxID=751969 RepID=A0A939DLJ3_9ALTE|nr:PapB/FocB family fimbrial expression transcriptional regulator [Bowmanella dokdonensis]MBN7824769.1 hypothetical protein [Bowmanella dokdonensis]